MYGKRPGRSIAVGLGIAPAPAIFRRQVSPALPQPLAILGREVEKALARFNEPLPLILGQCFETTPAVFDASALLWIVPAIIGLIAATVLIGLSAPTLATIVIVFCQLKISPGHEGKGVGGGAQRRGEQ